MSEIFPEAEPGLFEFVERGITKCRPTTSHAPGVIFAGKGTATRAGYIAGSNRAAGWTPTLAGQLQEMRRQARSAW